MSASDKLLNALTLLGKFENATVKEPMIAMVNDRTVMVNGDGLAYLLIYSKRLSMEGFVQIEFHDNIMRLVDKQKIILKKNVSTFEDYRKRDRRIGMKMNAI